MFKNLYRLFCPPSEETKPVSSSAVNRPSSRYDMNIDSIVSNPNSILQSSMSTALPNGSFQIRTNAIMANPISSNSSNSSSYHPLISALSSIPTSIPSHVTDVYLSRLRMSSRREIDHFPNGDFPAAIWRHKHPAVTCFGNYTGTHIQIAFANPDDRAHANAWIEDYYSRFENNGYVAYAPIPDGEHTLCIVRFKSEGDLRLDAWLWISENCRSPVYKAWGDDHLGRPFEESRTLSLAFASAQEAIAFRLVFG